MAKALLWVQHLLGIGHIKRTASLSRAMTAAGMDVVIASGGLPVENLRMGSARLHQLPGVRAVDLYFKDLRDENDKPIDDDWRARRKAATMALLEQEAPDIVITELFPFGRRQFLFELEALLTEARAGGALTVCSVRDILVAPPKPERLLEMLERAERLFDRILVHGDPDLVPFEETFPHTERLKDKLAYTGYVVEEAAPAKDQDGLGEVIVSAGGGAVSEPLLRAAIAAHPLCDAGSKLPWRLLCGAGLGADLMAELRAQAGNGLIVETARPDFPGLLRRARLSVSQAGYNTVMDVLAAGIPGVVVPYAGGLESEQTLRARRLEERGVLQVVDEDKLTPTALAAAIDKALATSPEALAGLSIAGGAETPRILLADLAARPG